MNYGSKKMVIDKLNKEAEKIHNSTKSDVRFLSPAHNYLRSKFKLYYNWHLYSKAQTVHKTVATSFLLFATFFVAFYMYSIFKPQPALAASNSITWTDEAHWKTNTFAGDINNKGANDWTTTRANLDETALAAGDVKLTSGWNWTATSTTGAPTGRKNHTVVWTGSKMIVWGGTAYDEGSSVNTGGIYDPSTNTWTATSTTGAPTGRSNHTAVWTGSKMIVWGGANGTTSFLNTGGIYDPSTNTWTATSTTGAPEARTYHTAVWTGSKMIVWGGIYYEYYSGGGYLNTGGIYDPSTNTWTATSTTDVVARGEHTAVWTGTKMIVWGGNNYVNTGGIYDPSTNTWTATSTTNAPAARKYHTAVWTGSKMIVWGGYNGSYLGTGGIYDLSTNTWTATSTTGAPAARYEHTAVWTGSKMIVWNGANGAGYLGDGGFYDPSANTWTAVPTTNAPAARFWHEAVWTGTKMIVWGGFTASGYTSDGGILADSYASPGTIGATGTGLRINAGAGKKAKWSSITSTFDALASGQAVKYAIRTSNDGTSWNGPYGQDGAAINWTDGTGNYLGKEYNDASVRTAISGMAASQYAEIVVRLESDDGAATPVLYDVTLNYDTLENPPLANMSLSSASNGTFSSGGTEGTYTKDTTINFNVPTASLTCTSCGTSTNRRAQIEVVATGQNFNASGAVGTNYIEDGGTGDGDATVNGVIVRSNESRSGSPAFAGGTGYHWRARAVDNEGRVSGWTSYGTGTDTAPAVADFSIDTTAPTVSNFVVKGNSTASADYINGTQDNGVIRATFDLSDNVSISLDVQFSSDGTNWGKYNSGTGVNNSGANWDNYITLSTGTSVDTYTTIPNGVWKLSGDGTGKTVYCRVRDGAGNVTANNPDKVWTTTADFDSGTKSNIDTSNNDVKLSNTVTGTGAQGDVTISTTRNINEFITGYNPDTGVVPNFNNLTITSTGILTTSAQVGLEFKVKGTLNIQSGGKIDANGKGYAGGAGGAGGAAEGGSSGSGPGPGGGAGTLGGGGGAGYGGSGGKGGYFTGEPWWGGSGGSAYTNFLDFGSGGGGGGSSADGGGGSGGNGGGAVKIQADTITLNGTIVANGNSGQNSSGGYGGGGGGAGGAIWMKSMNNITNAGNIYANGGAGGVGDAGGTGAGGGGAGGGRVKIEAPSITGTPSVSGGAEGTSIGSFVNGSPGSSGVYTSSGLSSIYASPGTIGATGNGLQFDSGNVCVPTSLTGSWDALVSGQKIKFAIRTSDNGTEWSSWLGRDGAAINWSTNYLGQEYGGTAYTNITGIAGKKYVQVQVRLESDGSNTPTLHDITLGYPLTDTITLDTQAPTSTSVSVDAGATYSTDSLVDLTLNADGGTSGMGTTEGMRFSNSGGASDKWSAWEAYGTSKTGWDITNSTYGGNTNPGNKTVYVQFKDNAGNTGSVVTKQPSSGDATISEQVPNNNYGLDQDIRTNDYVGYRQRSVLKFDFSSDIPSGASINNANLSLLVNSANAVGRTMDVNRITQPAWVEGDGSDGVTWNNYNGGAWTTPGGDYTTVDEVSSAAPASGSWQNWTGAGLEKQVQYALNNTSGVAHFLVKFDAEDPDPSGDYVNYWSKEIGVSSWHPKLSINYFIPTTDGIFYDPTAPTGTVSINQGDYTNSTNVDLTISASDGTGSGLHGTEAMRFSNNGSTWSNWEAYSTSKNSWDLTAFGGNSNQGTHTVYAQFKDKADNIGGSGASGQVTKQPSNIDNLLDAFYPTNNYGTLTSVQIYDEDIYKYRSLLKFDFLADIPSGSAIDSATLSLYYYEYAYNDPSGLGVSVKRVTQTGWTEAGSNWNTYDGTNNWTTAGGDFTETDSVSVNMPASYGWVDWGETGIKNQVQTALNNTSGVAHFIVKFDDETKTASNRHRAYFYSKDEATQTSLRPKLVINYNNAATDSITYDTVAPTVSTFNVNSNDTYTTSADVTLNISATDSLSGLHDTEAMQFSNDGNTWSTPEAYATSKSWNLVTGAGGNSSDGSKTVFARFKDRAGNTTYTGAASTFGLSSGDSDWEDLGGVINAMRFQNTVGTGALNKLEILFNDTSPNGNVRLGVYSDDNGSPGDLLLDAGEVTITNGWVGKDNLYLPVDVNAYYWIVYNMSVQNVARYQSGRPEGSHVWRTYAYGVFPSTFGTQDAYSPNNNQFVMRATVTSISDTTFLDRQAPSGTVTIDAGDYTGSETVNLNLSATDPGAPTTGSDLGDTEGMRFSNSGASDKWSAWEPYATSKTNWDITNATYGGNNNDGNKNVYVQFKDNAGNYQTVTKQPPAKDNQLQSNTADTNYGNQNNAYLLRYGDDTSIRNCLFTFDVSSDIPAGSTINSAYLSLDVIAIMDSNVAEFYFHKLTRPSWVEAEATWNIYSAGNSWTNPGGDYDSSKGGVSTGPSTTGWWNTASNLGDIVQDALDNVNGVVHIWGGIKNDQTTDRYIRFYTKDYTTDLSLRPKLVIQYSFKDSILLDRQAPGQPQSFTASTNYGDYIDTAWNYGNDTGSPMTEYKLERMTWTDYQLSKPWDGTTGSYKSYTYTSTGATHSIGDSIPEEAISQGVKYAYRISAKDTVNPSYGAVSSVISGITLDSVPPPAVTNVTVSPCDGTNNCSAKGDILHKGFETKITWNPSVDAGVGTSHYVVYRSTIDLTSDNYQNSTVLNSYKVVGVLPYSGGQSPQWYDNDANNDAYDQSGTTTYYDLNGDPITDTSGDKTQASDKLNDYTIYYYRIVAVDLNDSKTQTFPEIEGAAFNPAKAHENGNIGQVSERTPDVTAPSVPTNLTVTAMGIDDLNNDPPTQRIDISWGASSDSKASGRVPTGDGSGVATYKVFRALGDINGPTEAFSQVATVNSPDTSYANKGLNEYTYYYYKISALDNESNEGSQSDASSVKTASSSIPTVPSNVTVTAKTGNPNTDSEVGDKITISFNGSYAKNYAVDKYDIYRSETNWTSDSDWLNPTKATKITTLDITNTKDDRTNVNSFADSGLTDAKTYYYKVRALDTTPEVPDGGPYYSGFSAVSTGNLHGGWDTTPDSTDPAIPQNVTVKDIFGDDDYVRNIITWEKLSVTGNPSWFRNNTNDFREYKIYRYYMSGGVKYDEHQITKQGGVNPLYSESQDEALSTNYYVDAIPIAEANRDYYYYVTSSDNAGTDFKYASNQVINSYSNESSYVAPVSINPAEAKPTINTGSITVTNIQVSEATVNWITNQNTDSVVEYRIKGTNEVVGTIKDRTQMTQNHSVTIKSLNKGTTYEYRLISRNSLGNIDETAANTWREFTTQSFSISNISSSTTTTTATITWSTPIASDSQVEYKLQANPGESQESSKTAGDPALTTNHSVTIKALKPGRTYTYKVRSVTSDKYVAETGFLSFQTKPYDAGQFIIAPTSTKMEERHITATSAKITWVTEIPISSWVEYGTQSGKYVFSAGTSDLTKSHLVELTNLIPNTLYYYRVKGKDQYDFEYISQEYTFRALAMPEVSNVKVSNITPYTATITWTTNVVTDSAVNYGTVPPYNQRQQFQDMVLEHSLILANLTDNTTYHFQVESKDDYGNVAKSEDATFTTPLDTEGPKISEVKLSPLSGSDESKRGVMVTWVTDKEATSQVEYSEGVTSGRYEKKTPIDTSLNLSHTIMISDLEPGTTYHLRLISRDKRDNETKSQDYTMLTQEKEESILDLILKTLEDTFSWVKKLRDYLGQHLRKLFKK